MIHLITGLIASIVGARARGEGPTATRAAAKRPPQAD
jgi:hypothetical protein